MARLLLVDDDTAFRRYAVRVLGLEGHEVSTAVDMATGLEALAEGRFDLLLLDLNLPDGDAINLLKQLPDSQRLLPVVILTGRPSLDSTVEAIRLGVIDYQYKPEADLPQCVNAALERARSIVVLNNAQAALQKWNDALQHVSTQIEDLYSDVLRSVPAPAAKPRGSQLPLEQLSRREFEVLTELCQGFSNKEIASRLYVSTHTVRNHLKSIFRKLSVHSRTELIARVGTLPSAYREITAK